MTLPRSPDTPAWQLALADSLAEALPRLLEEPGDPLVQELIGALTAALCRGDVMLDCNGPPPPGVSAPAWPQDHRRALQASRLAREPDGPLVLAGGQLSWRRWIERQQAVLSALLERGRPLPIAAAASGPLPPAEAALVGLDPQQRRAVEAALRHRLVLILGGPGTGKTSTVGQLLAAVRRDQPGLRLQLAAPTGKAAARLRSAAGGAEACSTLHRLLESRGDGFARDRYRPLELDLLVIDELSMVDLELMEALLEALPPACRLVLVGDPAQLPPIAPGSVLQALQQPAAIEALAAVRFELRTTYRNDGAIARVAAALRDAIAPAPQPASAASAAPPPECSPLELIRPLLEQLCDADNLSWQQASRRRLPDLLLQRLALHQQRLAALAADCGPDLECGWQELLAERDRLLVLSPLRRGRWGVEAIHRALLAAAPEAGGVAPLAWPNGTPVLCRRNLPGLGLANGDLGVLVHRAGEPAAPHAQRWILFGQEEPLWLHPAQLSGALEPALALTVHKAQGSEARELVVLLEDADRVEAPLLYTALTRAREQALLITGLPEP